jgi:hypothetical protein
MNLKARLGRLEREAEGRGNADRPRVRIYLPHNGRDALPPRDGGPLIVYDGEEPPEWER